MPGGDLAEDASAVLHGGSVALPTLLLLLLLLLLQAHPVTGPPAWLPTSSLPFFITTLPQSFLIVDGGRVSRNVGNALGSWRSMFSQS